jgi:hypothetical protein
MPPFVHTPLLWGLLAAALPVLIHLLQLLRHRRVPWAAMEFLLASQKKNRVRVLLAQLLLLLLRVAAVVLLVLALAKPRLYGELSGLFGTATTHHVVLLDDSYSMSDRWDDTTAFDEAKSVVARLAEQASREVRAQTFTLLRFSRAGAGGRAAHPDLLQSPIGPDFTNRLRKLLDGLAPSQTAAGPLPALEALGPVLGDASAEHRVIYLVSDFRARDWADPRDLRTHLAQFHRSGAALCLVQCVDQAHPNLAIADLAPGDDIRAAGVPLSMEVTVQNFGPAAARNVPVVVVADGQPRPAVTVAEIPPGRAVKERFPVQFAAAGEHRLETRLENDCLAADNQRYCVLDLPPAVPALVIEGDPEGRGGWYLTSALAPGGAVASGISPRVETPRFLSTHPLDDFRAVYLVDVGPLERTAVEALERYVSAGGGLALFLGDHSSPRAINEQLYRDGRGLFPAPLASPAELTVDRLQPGPDLEVGGHPLFAVFAGSRNPFLTTVGIRRYMAVDSQWRPAAGRTEVVARLRNGAPLAIEHAFGGGRVVAFLTTAAPLWNNWARGNPSFVVTVQRLQALLGWRPKADVSHGVGAPWELHLDPARYAAQVRFLLPSGESGGSVEAAPAGGAPVSPGGATGVSPAGGVPAVATLAATETAGFYQARLHRKDGADETRTMACNVDAAEGDLRLLDPPRLSAALEGIPVELARARQFHYTPEPQAGNQIGDALLFVLILLLVAEQVLAWSASYHPPGRTAAVGHAVALPSAEPVRGGRA